MTHPTNKLREALEEWKDCVSDCYYEVSNIGRVRVKKTQKILKQRKNPGGYMVVGMRARGGGNQITGYVSRLVAEAFIGPSPDNSGKGGSHVDHIDNVKTNNSVDNLQWLTNGENVKKSFHDNLRPNVTKRTDYQRQKPWMARIYRDGKIRSLGNYKTKEEAIDAWSRAMIAAAEGKDNE